MRLKVLIRDLIIKKSHEFGGLNFPNTKLPSQQLKDIRRFLRCLEDCEFAHWGKVETISNQ